jgi:hypothetical protein
MAAMLLFSSALFAQDPLEPLQLNVPYLCADGTSYTITRCAPYGRFEVCTWREEKNGQLVVEANSVRTQMYGRLRPCPVQRGAQPPTTTNSQAGQALNPPYLREMPSVERVMRGMQTGDPRETALRQMGAFYELMEIIKTLSGHREFRGFTPDEKRILDDYSMAQYKIGQAADAAFPGPYAKEKQLSLNMPYHYSRNDPRFGFEGIPVWKTFLTPTMYAQFAQIVGGENARYEAKVAEEKRTAAAALEANSRAAAAQAGGGQGESPFVRNDPGTLAARKCVESGRSESECLGEGLKTGLKDLMGPVLGNTLAGDITGTGSSFAGLRMSGNFSGTGFRVSFNDNGAVVNCGTLVPAGHEYRVERLGAQILVKVQNDPKPLVFTFRPDGKLAGPGPVEVAGRVVVGYRGGGSSAPGYEMQTHTTTQQRQIAAADVPNYNSDAVHQNGMEYSVSEQVTSTSYEPTPSQPSAPVAVTAPKTERCSVGILPGTPSVKLSAALVELLDSSQKAPAQPMGLRMSGTYAGQGGLSIEFRGDSATVECGPAHVAMPYTVEIAGGQVVVKVLNRSTPFTLQMQSDKTLSGSGTIDVAGRVVTGSRGDEILYAPKNARCTLGSLTAKN